MADALLIYEILAFAYKFAYLLGRVVVVLIVFPPLIRDFVGVVVVVGRVEVEFDMLGFV